PCDLVDIGRMVTHPRLLADTIGVRGINLQGPHNHVSAALEKSERTVYARLFSGDRPERGHSTRSTMDRSVDMPDPVIAAPQPKGVPCPADLAGNRGGEIQRLRL